MMPPLDLPATFGDIDIYLFDQLLRGRVAPGMRVLDAGCGGGRNLVYLLRAGFEIAACDADRDAVERVRALVRDLAPGLPATNVRHEPIEAMTFPDGWADVVISSAVLHFARDDPHFDRMLAHCWRVLRPGGLFFSRLASSIGIATDVTPLGNGRYRLPDGSDRYLVDEARLMGCAARLGGRPADPLKSTIVQGQRSMTTWVMWKPG